MIEYQDIACPYEKNRPCRVCEKVGSSCTLSATNMHNPENKKFTYSECCHCRSLSLVSIPPDLDKLYDRYNYYSFAPVESETFFRRVLKWFLHGHWDSLSRFAAEALSRTSDLPHLAIARLKVGKKARILDVGGGSGQFVFGLREVGYENALAIDPYLENDVIHSNGARILKASLEAVEGEWDLVMFNHVFEHLTKPVNALESAARLLKPDGRIVIRIPNIESYAARRFDADWFGLQAPTHIFLPSQTGMKYLCDRANIRIMDIFGENTVELWLQSMCYQLGFWHGHPYNICSSLKNKKILFPLPAFCKQDIRYWRELNRHICKTPLLCDWIGYVLGK